MRQSLSLADRNILAERWAAGENVTTIAMSMGFSPAALYKELERGRTDELLENKRLRYDPELGQTIYQASLRNRGRRPAAVK